MPSVDPPLILSAVSWKPVRYSVMPPFEDLKLVTEVLLFYIYLGKLSAYVFSNFVTTLALEFKLFALVFRKFKVTDLLEEPSLSLGLDVNFEFR